MYTRFFGLNEKPFSITPDPRYLFMSARHGEALAHLVYGVTESGGFMQLTGEVGTGKTTLVRTLLLNRMPANANVAVVLNPQLSALEFLVTICEELHVPVPDDRHSIKALIDTLNAYLLEVHADGRRTILVVDEAQNLAPDVLEQLRLLTNLETAKQKLLQIVLIGQPELRELLARNDLRQLAQRITGRYHLEPLSREETEQYIEHRLKVAGALGEVFDTGAKREVFRLTQGVPRLINVICDRALLGAFSIESRRVNRRIIRRAATEITGKAETANTLRRALPVVGIIAAVVISAGFLSLLEERKPTIDAAIEAAVPAIKEPADIAPTSEPEPEPVAEEAQASLDDQLQLAQELTNPQSALAVLLNLWGLEYRGGGQSGCAQAAAAGYSCLNQRGSWGNLKQFDRPAVLTLVDAKGQTHNVVLIRIEEQTVELSIGGVMVTHPVGEVSDMWLGQYMLLWRPPNGVAVSMAPGSRGPSVLWLRKSLAEIDARYRTDLPDSDQFDEDLQQKVRAFQREHRLDVDGVAGQQTQIIINTLLAVDDTPRLTVPRLAQE
ncbi:MAG: AAA family ATPase [Gammaproteobacteria bacterium]|nr:AAA family ATPase [Gammaproteobacteria bacterium]MDH3414777.1 AAA family ATPase [Gammaproteobacteria bacterium]